jgi:hypothetical protein
VLTEQQAHTAWCAITITTFVVVNAAFFYAGEWYGKKETLHFIGEMCIKGVLI